MKDFRRRIKGFEKQLGLVDREPPFIKIGPPPPAINPGAIELLGSFPRLPGESDQEYLDRYNDPGPEGWVYEVIDYGTYKIAWPYKSRGEGVASGN